MISFDVHQHSTFVGVAVMIALFPVPTELSKRTKGLQGAKARAVSTMFTFVLIVLCARGVGLPLT